jgi:hypothetical protein
MIVSTMSINLTSHKGRNKDNKQKPKKQ